MRKTSLERAVADEKEIHAFRKRGSCPGCWMNVLLSQSGDLGTREQEIVTGENIRFETENKRWR